MKQLLALIAALMATSLFLYALVSKDHPPRHQGLKSMELAPLIPLHDLYGASRNNQVNPSSTDTNVSWERPIVPLHSLAGQLTFPETNSDPRPLPAVLLVNAGQQAGMGPDNERTIRFLANRGYVVLSIDCGDFGDNDHIANVTTQHSSTECSEIRIAEGARTLVNQGIADPAALAIIGSGVGGYWALTTMSLEPGLFKAAILHSLVNGQANPSSADTVTKKPKPAAVKSGLHPVDIAANATSLDLKGHVQTAVLMSHGKADTVVGNDQAKAFAQRLSDAGMNLEFVTFHHEGQGYLRWQTRAQVARLTERFLARHLGGRDGGYDYIELLAKDF